MALVVSIAGVDKTSLLKNNVIRITKKSDGVNNFSFVLKTTPGTYMPSPGQEVTLADTDLSLGGIIKTIRKTRVVPVTGNTATVFIDVSCDGYNEIPERRTATIEYFNTTAGAIVEALRALTLNAEGISAGTINAGVDITYYLAVCKNVKEIYDDLAASSGYKWYIDGSKNLQFVSEETIVDASEDLVEGGSYVRFSDVTIEESLADYRNKEFVQGNFGPDGNLVYTVVQDDTEIAARLAIEGSGTGVYGNVIKDNNVKTEADAIVLANMDLKKHGFTPAGINYKSQDIFWVPGTRLKVNLPSLGISTDTYFLIEDVTITYLTSSIRDVTVRGTKRKAGTNFSTQRSQTGNDYFVKLVRKANGNGDVSSFGGGASITAQFSIEDYNASNAAEVTLTNTESTLLTKAITLDVKSDVKIFVSCKGIADDAMELTLLSYQDAAARTYQPKIDIFGANDVVHTYSDTIAALAAGSYTIAIKGITSNGNFVVPIGFANIDILVIPALSTAPLLDASGLTATAIDYQEIDLTWSNPPITFAGLELYRSESDLAAHDRAWCDANADLVYSGSNESYNNTGLDPDTLYYYKLFAVYENSGTYYSSGITASATTDASPFQQWAGYPQSPVQTATYPYQCIIRESSTSDIYLCADGSAPSDLLHVWTLMDYCFMKPYASWKLSGGAWTDQSFHQFPGDDIHIDAYLEANEDVLWWSTLDLLFAKTTP